MTDSEDNLLSSDVYSFRNEGTTIHAKGPNYTNISSFSCRNNFLTSTMHMPPRNFERRNMNYNQRSLYHNRDTSPMSLRSVPDFKRRNFHHPYNMGDTGYQRSVYNGRSCSPSSMRSIDTTTSISATDIALAIKNETYNKHDLWLIKEACNKYLKNKLRRRVEKRRKQRLFLKRKSGDDSGEQGSDSSISSDDCRSTRTVPSMGNNSRYKTTKLNVTNIRMTINEGNMYKDCTENLRKKSLKNIVCVDETMTSLNQSKPQNFDPPNTEKSLLMRDRFKNGYLLPSQRFNKSVTGVTSSTVPKFTSTNSEFGEIINTKIQVNNNKILEENLHEDIESDREEIFSEISTIERNTQNVTGSHKRNIDLDELNCNPQKKSKVIKMCSQKTDSVKENCLDNHTNSEFIFAKPHMPVRKTAIVKKSHQSPSPEKLISKSKQPLCDAVVPSHTKLSPVKELLPQNSSKTQNKGKSFENEMGDDGFNSASNLRDDVSMRPSFIKRKLFTQKLDVAEKKNISDTSQSSSPQVKNVGSNKEKNKARKLASSQSCLNREVLEEDNNFLDLIHRIVPAEQINLTNATNKTASNRNSQPDSDDKWDITSIISTCDDKDISDTYTDEEIFKFDKHCNNTTKENGKEKIQSQLTSNCRIVLQKLPPAQQTKVASSGIANKLKNVNKSKSLDQKNSKVSLKSFWDTDLESDLENYERQPCNLKDSQRIINKVNISVEDDKNCNKLQSHKVDSVGAPKRAGNKNKPQKVTNVKNTSISDKSNKTTKREKKNISPESKENNSNLSNISLRSSRSTQDVKEKEKQIETSKAVTLISHRMGRPKRQGKSKIINTIKSPSPKDSDISTSELNISAKSLRSYQKNNKVNEKGIARNIKTRNRSGVKGI